MEKERETVLWHGAGHDSGRRCVRKQRWQVDAGKACTLCKLLEQGMTLMAASAWSLECVGSPHSPAIRISPRFATPALFMPLRTPCCCLSCRRSVQRRPRRGEHRQGADLPAVRRFVRRLLYGEADAAAAAAPAGQWGIWVVGGAQHPDRNMAAASAMPGSQPRRGLRSTQCGTGLAHARRRT